MTYLRADAIRQKKKHIVAGNEPSPSFDSEYQTISNSFPSHYWPGSPTRRRPHIRFLFFLNNFCIHQAAGKKQNWAVANRLEKVDKSQLHAGFFNVQYQRRKKKQKQNKGL